MSPALARNCCKMLHFLQNDTPFVLFCNTLSCLRAGGVNPRYTPQVIPPLLLLVRRFPIPTPGLASVACPSIPSPPPAATPHTHEQHNHPSSPPSPPSPLTAGLAPVPTLHDESPTKPNATPQVQKSDRKENQDNSDPSDIHTTSAKQRSHKSPCKPTSDQASQNDDPLSDNPISTSEKISQSSNEPSNNESPYKLLPTSKSEASSTISTRWHVHQQEDAARKPRRHGRSWRQHFLCNFSAP